MIGKLHRKGDHWVIRYKMEDDMVATDGGELSIHPDDVNGILVANIFGMEGREVNFKITPFMHDTFVAKIIYEHNDYSEPNEALKSAKERYDRHTPPYISDDENVDLAFLFFRAESPSFSFVKIDSVGKVIKVAEKDPISPFAICSTYFIESSNKLFRFWDQIARTDKQSEKYLSQLAQTYLEHNLEVVAFELDSIHIYGTPDSLETAERYSR
jgi:hypothetical protein